MRLSRMAALVLGLSACGDAEPAAPAAPVACAAQELTASDGSCHLAGVPPEACAPGFAPRAQGCVAILPAEPCPAGSLALPGELACRPVADCPAGAWDFAPADPGREHVDASYAGGQSDGSAAHPWSDIQSAVNAAAPGAVVAIRDGSYPGNLLINKPLRLWGRCPAAVEIVGMPGLAALAVITAAARGTEIHTLAITGPNAGLGLSGVEDVHLDRLWIHDTGGHGAEIIAEMTPTSARFSGALIERSAELGLFAVGASVAIEASALRDIAPNAAGIAGSAIFARRGDGGVALPERARIQIASSLVERAHAAAISIAGSDLDMDATLVRDTAPQPNGDEGGFALLVSIEPVSTVPSTAIVRRSVLERSHEAGIVLDGAEALVEDTVVRDTAPHAGSDTRGAGVVIQKDVVGHRSNVTLAHSLIERSVGMGVLVASSDAIVQASLVRDTPAWSSGILGDAILVIAHGSSSRAEVAGSWLEDSLRAGIASFGADVSVSGTVLECNLVTLASEPNEGVASNFDDGGNNRCGCDGAVEVCRAQSANLAPPPPL
jgi:hypothetical protein